MGSESEFSSDGSDHEDSDTIVISSKSRILISPRKKGSKAVSKLLGTAADDVVEQLLRGSDGRAEVVSRAKQATVRMKNREYEIRDGDVDDGDCQSTNSKTGRVPKSTGQVGRREAALQHHAMTTVTERRVNQANERTSVSGTRTRGQTQVADVTSDNASEYSDLSSDELSAPSSDGGEHIRRTPRAQQQQQSREPSHKVTPAAASTTGKTQQRHNGRHRHAVAEGHDSNCDHSAAEDGESDASGSTKDSSISQREREIRSSGQRKFDDQLQASVQSSRHAAKTHNMKRRGDYHDEPSPRRASKPYAKRTQVSRHEDVSELDDSVILPTSATQEMEDLKQTLKNLAHQDPIMSVSSSSTGNKPFLLSNPPKKGASFADTSRGADQVRKQEYVGSVQNGYEEAAWSSTTSALTRFDEATTKKSGKFSFNRRGRRRGSEDDDTDSDHFEAPIARRLFSTPPQRHASSRMSTPPTIPASFVSKRTPSPKSTPYSSSNGYSSILDTSLTAAVSSSAQGSRAVLSALKALQDKIRRLEDEREQLMQELSDVKVKARKVQYRTRLPRVESTIVR
jgi:hypothetical protein